MMDSDSDETAVDVLRDAAAAAAAPRVPSARRRGAILDGVFPSRLGLSCRVRMRSVCHVRGVGDARFDKIWFFGGNARAVEATR